MADSSLIGRLSARPVLVLGTAAVLMQTVDMLLVVAVDALFLQRIGPSYLPHAFALVNAAAVALIVLVLTLRTVSIFQLMLRMTVALALAALVSVPLVAHAGSGLLFAVFLVIRLHDNLCFTYFLTYAQGVFPVREAKTRLAVVLGASSAACVLSGLAVRPLVVRFSIQTLFAVAALSATALVAVLVLCRRCWPPPVAEAPPSGGEPAPDSVRRHPLADALDFLVRSPLAAHIVALFLLMMALRCLLEFQFSRVITTMFTDEVQLAGFVGPFKAGMAITFTLGQLFLTSRLLVRLHPGGTMTLVPAIQLALALVTVVAPLPVPVMAMQAFWYVGAQVCTRPAFNILLAPLDGATRDRIGLLASLADALGSMGGGLALIAVQNLLGIRTFFVGIALLYVANLLVTRRLDDDYVGSLREAVTRSDTRSRIDSMATLEYVARDRGREHLAQLLDDPEPAVRIEAVLRLDTIGADGARPLLERLLRTERDPRVMATAARVLPDLLGSRTLEAVEGLVAGASDDRSLANLLEVIGQLRIRPAAEVAARHLDHAACRVRVAAVLAVIRLSPGRPLLERALSTLASMRESPDPAARSAAVVALGDLRCDAFVAPVTASLSDASEAVRINAVRSLVRLGRVHALPRLREVADRDPDPEVRGAAARACREIEESKLDDLVRLVRRLTPGERTRVGAFLKAAPDTPRLTILDRLLALGLETFPGSLLDRVRQTDDPALLEAVAACLDPAAPGLRPLADRVDLEPGAAVVLPFVAELGRVLPGPALTAAVAEQVGLCLVLDLARAHAVRVDAPGVASNVDRLRREAVERLFVWVTAIEGGDDPATLAGAFEGSLSSDRHLASMSVDLLESRLPPATFALLQPVLDRAGTDAPDDAGREFIRARRAMVPRLVDRLRPRLQGETLGALLESLAPVTGGVP